MGGGKKKQKETGGEGEIKEQPLLLMVKTLELKVEEKFRKDRISKDQMAEAVKPGFLR